MKATAQPVELRTNPNWIDYSEVGGRQPSDAAIGVLRIVIPYTTPELTMAALRHAAVCTDLNVHVSLVDVQAIPFPCPLNQPPIDRGFSKLRLQDLFLKCGLPGTTSVVYTRDWLEGFRRVVERNSLVILATKKHWWRTREEKIAGALLKAGHHVMLLHV
jgi:hypothetical protein